MHLTHHLALALFLAVVPLAAPQGEKKQDQKPEKPLSAPQVEAERIRDDLIGAWQLTRAQTAGESFSGGGCRGVMLMMDGYMSITAQLDSKNPSTRFSTGELFSSGAYRWTYDGDRLMLTTTTMVSIDNFSPGDQIQYEPAGIRREYRIDLSDTTLSLNREGGGMLLFTRMSPPPIRDEPPTKAR